LYAFCFEVQVIPDGVAYDGLLNSQGGIFYQEAVGIVALLVEAEPLGMMTSGQDLLSKGIDVKIFPPGVEKALPAE
jgi:hypothetical protein